MFLFSGTYHCLLLSENCSDCYSEWWQRETIGKFSRAKIQSCKQKRKSHNYRSWFFENVPSPQVYLTHISEVS